MNGVGGMGGIGEIGGLVELVRTELGVPVSVDDVDRELADLPGWDSMHVLWLVTLIEERTGRSVSVIDLLEAPTLAHIHGLMVSGTTGEDAS